ncbi:Hydroxypyruvate reductase [Emticicia aquatica]|uniref:Hydroxypyruvate reductase n=1 Tax=Emticicia aquatica TaxID=1681835 RepID=A0ABN8ET05_9BACT|nr:hydroxyacid dehydrogenase [Emticicia aquatica]CAH0996134.1 Hydroxypyruvate reductase [Emticicia aquatica]
MKKNVLLLETIADEAYQLLAESQNIQIFTAYGEQSLTDILSENSIDAVITRGKGQVNLQLMDACPDLKVAARCGVGLDNLNVKEATARKIKVVNAPGSNASTIAEHTISLILMLQRNLYNAINEVKSSNWNWRNQYEGDEINGKTLGILGLGNIGKKVAKIADAFGMKVVYWNRSKVESPYEFLTFEEVLRQSDIISIHLPLVTETKQLIDKKALALMKPNAILINTARAIIVDQDALLEALNNKTIAGYGADVPMATPPSANDPLMIHPNTLITPHVGSLTTTTYTNMCVSTVKNVLAILNEQQPQMESIFNRNEL